MSDMSGLAEKVVSCKGWKWMPGMLAAHHTAHSGVGRRISGEDALREHGWFPVLTDPATGGAVLHLLAVLCHTQTNVSALSAGVDEWEVWTIRGKSSGPSLGEAAAAALLLLETVQ